MDRRPQLEMLLATRTVSTTIPDRASYILPAVHSVSRAVKQPLNIVEIGCSAGLNLIFDAYRYDYGDGPARGDSNSPLTLCCKVTGGALDPDLEMPRLARRIGIDLVRFDASDVSDRRWMDAMLLPEWERDRERLRLALALAADRPIELVTGDALQVLSDILESLVGPVCVVNSHCLYQWPQSRVDEFDRLLRHRGQSQPIHRLDIEAIKDEPLETMRARLLKLADAGIPLTEKSIASDIVHSRYESGDCERNQLGVADGFGGWIDWRASSRKLCAGAVQ